jgi:ring-1,2-phenylacetyl-CoA epoxidase subunit PaaC
MDKSLQSALAAYLVALADDELILGHRNSEWAGHAPILEEDIAFANLALDEIGHARLWYEVAATLLGVDPTTYPDQQTFVRPAAEFRCLQFVELPKGDWAFSMLRQYLFDAFEASRLEALVSSTHKPLADIAAKIRNEELYHLRHTQAWVTRLGLGTEESQRRMQTALDELWPYAQALGQPLPGEIELLTVGLVPSSVALFTAWQAEVSTFLKESGLLVPQAHATNADRSVHSEYLDLLVNELQEVAQLDPGARW